MAVFEVRHRYRSVRDGRQFGPWQAGDSIELAEADAHWVNRDSPGCLLAASGTVKPADAPVGVGEDAPERQNPAGPNRQHRGGRPRSSS